MDLFTQAVLGSAVGGFVASKKIGNKAFAWGAICGLIPDFDVFFTGFFETTKSLFVHRGISHSVFFIMLLAPFVGLLLRRFNKDVDYPLSAWTNFAFWTIVTHPILDIFTNYGTGFFEPFSDKRYALSSIAVVDLFYTIPLLMFVLIAVFKKKKKIKQLFAAIGLFVSILYICFTFMNKLYIQSEFEKELTEKGIPYQRTEIFPTVPTNLMWNCLAQDQDCFWFKQKSNISSYDSEIELYKRNDYSVIDFENDERLKNLQQFSRFYYSQERTSDTTVLFRDLRFGKFGQNPYAPFVFQFEITHNDSVILEVEQLRFDWKSLLSEK